MRGVASKLVAALTLILIGVTPAQALETLPGSPSLVDGPLFITKYSFQGTRVRFVEFYNSSNQLVDLNGWRLAIQVPGATGPTVLAELDGLIAPGAWITAGERASFEDGDSSTFVYDNPTIEPANIQSVLLLPPPNTYLTHTVSPSVTASTPRLPTDPATFGYQRNVSTSSGNYLTTYSAVLPDDSFLPFDDGLYEPPSSTPLQIVEVYPNPPNCSPLDTPASSPLCFDYVKVFNTSSRETDMAQYRVRSGSATQTLQATIPARSYAILFMNLNNTGWVWIEDRYGAVAFDGTMVNYPDAGGSRRGQAWASDGSQWRWTQYPTPYDTPNQFTDGMPVNSCEHLRLSEIGANLPEQFVEIMNESSSPVELGGCQLRTNRSEDAKYVFGPQLLEPRKVVAVSIATSGLTLTKTTAGTVYILSSDGSVEVDARHYENLSAGSSLALIDGVWRQTFTITPGALNEFTEYPPCDEGYVRNTETGRCNKVAVTGLLGDCGEGRERNLVTGRCRAVASASALTPCRPGQVRNPETNRCRAATTASTTLTPCREGQERNPETNRCRSIQSGSTLQPCAPGQERNPETNRCRRVATLAAADGGNFPVEPIVDTGRAFAAWWALGGVVLLGAGYGAWEWRSEIGRIVRTIMSRSKVSE